MSAVFSGSRLEQKKQFCDKENDIETEIVFLMIFNLNINQYEYLATNDDKAKCTVALPNIQRA